MKLFTFFKKNVFSSFYNYFKSSNKKRGRGAVTMLPVMCWFHSLLVTVTLLLVTLLGKNCVGIKNLQFIASVHSLEKTRMQKIETCSRIYVLNSLHCIISYSVNYKLISTTLVMCQTPFYWTSNELEHVHLCHRTRTPYFWLRTIEHRTSNLIQSSLHLLNYSSNWLEHHFFEHRTNSNVFILW